MMPSHALDLLNPCPLWMLETHRRPADFVTEDSSMKLDKQHEIEAITGLSSLPLVSAMMGIMELQGDVCALHLPQPTVIRRAGLELIEINYMKISTLSLDLTVAQRTCAQ